MLTWHVASVAKGFLALRAELTPPGEKSESGIYLVRSPGNQAARDGTFEKIVRPWRCVAMEGSKPTNEEIFATKQTAYDPRDFRDGYPLIPESVVDEAMIYGGVDPLARTLLVEKVGRRVSEGLHEVSWEPDPMSDKVSQAFARGKIEDILEPFTGTVVG